MTLREATEVLKELKRLCYPDSLEGTARAVRNNEALDTAIGAMVMGQEYLDERKHGKWIEHGVNEGHLIEKYTCSECDYYTGTRTSNYCPNCGAKMDSGK